MQEGTVTLQLMKPQQCGHLGEGYSCLTSDELMGKREWRGVVDKFQFSNIFKAFALYFSVFTFLFRPPGCEYLHRACRE